MKKELEDVLYKKYPKLFRLSNSENRGNVGMSVGNGWYNIMDCLLSCIQSHYTHNSRNRWHIRKLIRDGNDWVVMPAYIARLHIMQIKEKMGGLRFYIGGGDDTIYNYIEMAEVMSEVTCETCGSPGKRKSVRGWIGVSCDQCNTNNKKA